MPAHEFWHNTWQQHGTYKNIILFSHPTNTFRFLVIVSFRFFFSRSFSFLYLFIFAPVYRIIIIISYRIKRFAPLAKTHDEGYISRTTTPATSRGSPVIYRKSFTITANKGGLFLYEIIILLFFLLLLLYTYLTGSYAVLCFPYVQTSNLFRIR